MSSENRKLIQGQTVEIGGDSYVVPPLNFVHAEEHEEAIMKFDEALRAESKGMRPGLKVMKSAIPIIGAAIRRNYPDLTDEILADKLDIVSLREAWTAAIGVPRSAIVDLLKRGDVPNVPLEVKETSANDGSASTRG